MPLDRYDTVQISILTTNNNKCSSGTRHGGKMAVTSYDFDHVTTDKSERGVTRCASLFIKGSTAKEVQPNQPPQNVPVEKNQFRCRHHSQHTQRTTGTSPDSR